VYFGAIFPNLKTNQTEMHVSALCRFPEKELIFYLADVFQSRASTNTQSAELISPELCSRTQCCWQKKGSHFMGHT